MKKRNTLFTLLAMGAFAALCVSCESCKSEPEGDGPGKDAKKQEVVATDATSEVPTKEYSISDPGFDKTYLVADLDDNMAVYKENVDPSKALIVISKREYRLYVYETGADTTLAASFPVCYAKNPGQKSREGDNSTPECSMSNPFHVSEIKAASEWTHDFGDGRGEVLAYGDWFIRLDLSKSFPDNEAVAKNRSIGIHGSTNNEASVPGRDSGGCIRLRDQDLNVLRKYVDKGTTVVIKPISEGKLPFEVKAEKALGEKYKGASIGNPIFKAADKAEDVPEGAPEGPIEEDDEEGLG